MFGKNPFNEYRATQKTLEEKTMTSAERAKEMQKQADAAKKKASAQAAKAGIRTEGMEGMVCKSCGDKYGQPTNEKCMYDSKDPEGKNWMKSETKNEATDPVNKKELKGKHKDRKDKDIDNDGDVDSSDKFLHRRRKAISKSNKESDVEVNPKMDKEQKESRIRSALKSILEGDRAKHYKGATKPEGMHDKTSPGGKEMMNQPTKVDDTEEKGHIDAVKAGQVTKTAKARSGGDNISKGDKKIVQGGTPVKGSNVKKTMEAYASMFEKKIEDHEEIGEDVDKAVSTLKKKTRDGNWHNKNGKVAHPYLKHDTVRKKLDKHGMNKVPHHTPPAGSAP